MRKFASLFVLFGMCAMPAYAAVEDYKDVSVVDVNCSTKAAAKHFLKFDANGNAKIVEALKASDKNDHLRVDVSGDVQGDTLKVTSIKLL